MLRFVLPVIGLLIACPVISQKISFSYDAAGNRISRFAETSLPVRLVHFSVAAKENVVTIRWETAEEENVSHFELERSPDGLGWRRIAEVISRQYRDTASPGYVHVDADPPPGRHFYRLKITDEDGSLSYSKLESVFLAPELRLYPNPAKDYLLIESPFKMAVSYEVVAADGRVVLQGRLGPESRVYLGALLPALYIIRLSLASGQTFTHRIVKE